MNLNSTLLSAQIGLTSALNMTGKNFTQTKRVCEKCLKSSLPVSEAKKHETFDEADESAIH